MNKTKSFDVDVVESSTYKLEVMLKFNGDEPIKRSLFVTIGHINGKPVQVFATIGKPGYIERTTASALSSLINVSLKSGASIYDIIDSLSRIQDADTVTIQTDGEMSGEKILSIPDGIAKALEKFINKHT